MDVNDTRSRNMAAIKSKDTLPERLVRSILHRAGFRFRKNDPRLPGTPDIHLPKWKCVIFVNGCFWHRHQNCRYTTTPKSNIEFWEKKFRANVERDARKYSVLAAQGVRVIIIWECELNGSIEHLQKQLMDQITNPAE
ncbi:MAG: very short patch repair endonuclease [Nitrosomonas sp.]|uniref:very short patch repair endonuclease n=1 Tax=Nitrosomonas sp. TaxID=42353 RepID=UPI0025E4D5DB|nr:very short patch repair endonuclease [Nitrosomonas sp.]MBY0473677.1 very short patch repair endonuclease [Nitrosomonas sp.]